MDLNPLNFRVCHDDAFTLPEIQLELLSSAIECDTIKRKALPCGRIFVPLIFIFFKLKSLIWPYFSSKFFSPQSKGSH